jgi:(R)-2-hydroxyacyl-CoA dehydratese activating ATPase
MYYLGIDIGSLSCDAVLIDRQQNMIATAIVPTGAKNREAIALATEFVLNRAGISRDKVKATVSTGYGRDRVEEKLTSVTEISCHAKGMQSLRGGTRVLIDIGGQDSKCILMSDKGTVVNFAMNDKCAAGTGRFLEAMARALQVDINDMGDLDAEAKGDVTISSMCTVFAESEVVSLIAEGAGVNEIVKGLNRSIASRTVSLIKRVMPDYQGMAFAMSGGVARNRGVVRAIEEALDHAVFVPDIPDTVGALGAALFAIERSIQ